MKQAKPQNFESTLAKEYDDYRISSYYDTLYWLGKRGASIAEEYLSANCPLCDESMKDCKVYGGGMDYDGAHFYCKNCDNEKKQKGSRKL